jgi:hypothetical protein
MVIQRADWVLGAALAAALGALSCESLTGLDDFQLKASLGDAGLGEACNDPSGFEGRGCYSCAPTLASQLLNACTTVGCTPFDNATRIPDYVAGAYASGKGPHELTPAPLVPAPTSTPPSGSGASAAPPHVKCADLSPRPVYLYGSSALNLGLRTLAQAISATATLVYQNDTSCLGLDAILTGLSRLKGTAQYWIADQSQPTECDIEGDQLADIGLCDLSPETCVPNFSGNANLVDDIGPAQVFMFTVPNGSAQKSISAEAAFTVFAYDEGGVEPWTDPSSLMRRGPSSGNQLTIGASLNLPPAFWRGVIKQKSSEMKPALLALPDPNKALGITSADVADDPDSKANLRTLAYQHYGQSCAFTPDSSLGSSDKRNVRDGHYELWAPFHFYTHGQNGRTQDPFVAEIVSYLTGARPLPNRNTDFITTLKQAGLVPLCAMHVTRAREGARMAPLQPSPSCNCYYESSPPGGQLLDSCKACASSADCSNSAPNCNFGFCEP